MSFSCEGDIAGEFEVNVLGLEAEVLGYSTIIRVMAITVPQKIKTFLVDFMTILIPNSIKY